MTDAPQPLPLQLTFRYRHALGARRAFLEALAEGRALASACAHCRQVCFPPRGRCPRDGQPTEQRWLSGLGEVVAVSVAEVRLPLTERVEATAWLLVRMEGADNAVLGRLATGEGAVRSGDRVRLVAEAGSVGHPIQRLTFARPRP